MWARRVQVRKILPATARVPPVAHGNEDGLQSSSSSSHEKLLMNGDPINRSAEEHLASLTPSGPCGSTPGLASGSSRLPPPPSQELLPVTTDLYKSPPSGAPPVAISSDLTLLRGSASNQCFYDNYSTTTLISSLILPKLPPTLHIPLYFLGGPGLQVSQMTPRELELSL